MKLGPAFHASLIAAGLLVSPVVHAGPVEVTYAAEQDPVLPDEIVVPYVNGGGGLFISQDAANSFGLMCASQVSPKLTQSGNSAVKVLYNDGSIYIAAFEGLYKGDKNGCNFVLRPDLMKFVSDVAADPIDPKRVYAVTSVASPALNGIYASDSGAPFVAFGAQEMLFVNTIHAVKNGTGRRFYETGVVSDLMTNKVTYSVRYSDDDAQTFTSSTVDVSMFGMPDPNASFSIIAVDPRNPDRVIARVKRDADLTSKDNLLESVDAGKTFRNVMELGELRGAAFTPDGKLYIGDNDQDERKFYVIDQAGADARLIGSGWKVGCLAWDDGKKRMLGCTDVRVGTVDLETGAFTALFDGRCAGSFVECPGALPAADACRSQLTAAYCGYGHYAAAPVCAPYTSGMPDLIAACGYVCKDGMAIDPSALVAASGTSGGYAIADAGGAAGSSGSFAGSAGGSAAPLPAKSNGGCGCALAQARARHATAAWLIGIIGYGAFRRRRRR